MSGEVAAKSVFEKAHGQQLRRVGGCGEEWSAGRHVIERARKASMRLVAPT
jgi:hypothetical protein